MFKKKPRARRADPLKGLPRGGGQQNPNASITRFPTAQELIEDHGLAVDPTRSRGEIPLGLVDAVMDYRGPKPVAIDGTWIGRKTDQSLIVFGPPREDKGRAFGLAAAASYPFGFVSVDPKGDVCSAVARLRHERYSQFQVVLDGFNTSRGVEDFKRGCNPLALAKSLDLDGKVQIALLVADAIVAIGPTNNMNSHWDEAAQTLLFSVLLFVLMDERFDGRRDLVTVHKLITRKLEDGLKEEMLDCELADGMIGEAASEHFDREDRERSGVNSTLRRHMRFLYYPAIRRMLEAEDCPLAELPNGKMSAHVCLPAMQMGPCAGFIRLILNTAFGVFEMNEGRRAFQDHSSDERCLFLVDEAAVLGPCKLTESAAQLPGLGVLLVSVWQSYAQIRATQREHADTFLASAGTWLVFGARDPSTLDLIEKSLGSTLVYMPSERTPSLDSAIRHGDAGSSLALNTHPLMSKTEIANLIHRDSPKGRMLVYLSGIGWVMLTRGYADKERHLLELFGEAS